MSSGDDGGVKSVMIMMMMDVVCACFVNNPPSHFELSSRERV